MEIANPPNNQSTQLNPKFSISVCTPYFKYFLLPILAASYPTLFFYGNNVHELLLINLGRTLIIYALIALVAYLAFLAKYRSAPVRAAISAFIFIVFFNIYGLLETS